MNEAVTIAITAKSQGVDEELQKTKNKFDKLNQSILSDSSNKSVKNISQSLGNLGKIGDSLGGVFGKITGGISSLLSPIGLATAALGGLITLGINMYKKLTLSHDEYIDYLNYKSQNSQKRLTKVETQQKTANGYFQRLKQLNRIENISNATREQAITIIQLLTRQYGDLGLSIDKTTGKIIGLDNAFTQFQNKVNSQRNKELKTQADIATNQAQFEANPLVLTLAGRKKNTRFESTFLSAQQQWKQANAGYGSEQGKRIASIGVQRMKTFNLQNGYKNAENQVKSIADLQKQIKDIQDNAKTEGRGLTTEQKQQLVSLKQQQKTYKKIAQLKTQLTVAETMVDATKADDATNKYWKNVVDKINQAIDAQQKYNLALQQSSGGAISKLQKQKALTDQIIKLNIKNLQQQKKLKDLQKDERQARKQYEYSRKDKQEKVEFHRTQAKKLQNLEENALDAEILQKSGMNEVFKEYGQQITKLLEKEKNNSITIDEQKTLDMLKAVFGNRIQGYIDYLAEEKAIMKDHSDRIKEFQRKFGKEFASWTEQEKNLFTSENGDLVKRISNIKARGFAQNSSYNQLKEISSSLSKKQETGTLSIDQVEKLLQVNRMIALIEADKVNFQTWQAQLNKEITENAIKRKKIEDELKDIFKDGNRTLDQQLQLQQLLLEGDIKRIEKQKILNMLKNKGWDIEKIRKTNPNIDKDIDSYVDKTMELNKQKYMNAETKSIQKQIQLEKLKLQGKFDEIQRLKIINDLREKGVKYEEKDVDNLMKKRKELSALQFSSDVKSQAQGLEYQLESKINKKQAQIKKRTREYQQKYGTLTDEQKNKIKQLVTLEIKFDQLQDRKSYLNTDIQTNQLTRRGGFASGAVFTDKDTVNKEIKNINIKQANLLKQIKDLIDGAGKI